MTDTATKQTPMMERYLEVKADYPDSLLLFRMGDFYELFHEDAKVAAKVLGITLTSRDKNSENPTPMSGFPYHALDGYLQKLIRAGHRAAICEQMEDPKTAKGMVRREVTRVVTPGTLTEDSLLDPRQENFLACVASGREGFGLSWLELSTGRFYTTEVAADALLDELARIAPSECLVPGDSLDQSDPLVETLRQLPGMLLTTRPHWTFSARECHEELTGHFGTSTLEGFDLDESSTAAITSAGVLLGYVRETQLSSLGHILKIEPYRRGENLLIDQATRRSLELTRTLRESERQGSLLDVLDETVTPMGARLLADWLSNPLTNRTHIEARLDAVEELVAAPSLTTDLRNELEAAYDLQRLVARVSTGRSSPRDLACLGRTLALLPKLKALLSERRASLIQHLEQSLELCPDIRAEIDASLVDEPPLQITEGGIIRPGYHQQLDEFRDLMRGGKQWMASYQAEESERTGIPNLKIGFNKVFGYYLEVTAAQSSKVPDNYIRKQTLKNQERFVTPELKEYEDRVLRAEQQALGLEQELFDALRRKIAAEVSRLTQTAQVLASVDVLTTLAKLAAKGNYVRPEIIEDGVLEITDGRHPVLDRLRPGGEFVPNDIQLGGECGTVQIITGPNMAGKSTYIRQAALITILAQMGSFVPATAARIGIADRVFARVGASDELGRGQSTFMVEMTETARILNSATDRSLVILDEIGRGTSTYDGISLAWSITEFLHDDIGCRTLFATHYHELTELAERLPHVRNWNVAVREEQDRVIFLHKIVEGTADKSYGIHVARLAGVPARVLERAHLILETLETREGASGQTSNIPARTARKPREKQLTLFAAEEHPVLGELRDLNLDQMTPLEALQNLHRIRESLR